MSEVINKDAFVSYLHNDNDINDKAIETFINLIYDENEENRESITRSNFNLKYTSLLQLINDEDESIGEVGLAENDKEEINHNDNNKDNGNIIDDMQTKTPKKETQFVELGSPILVENSNYRIPNDLSIEAIELFKDMKFKEDKIKRQKLGYDSVIRPINNFHFNTGNNSHTHFLLHHTTVNVKANENNNGELIQDNNTNSNNNNKQSPRNNNNDDNDNGKDKDKDPLLNLLNQPTKLNQATTSNKTIFKSNALNYMNTQFKSTLDNTPNKTHSIQQKLQDVYYQILSPNNNMIDHNIYNTSPSKASQPLLYRPNYNVPITGVMSSNSPILNEDYFSKIYREINSAASTKSINRKVNQFINREKRNDLYQHYTRVYNRVPLNQRFEGLNKMLYCKSNNGLIEDKMLNEDDFVTLEDKISQFSLIKRGVSGKLKNSNSNSNSKNKNDNEGGNRDIELNANINEFNIEKGGNKEEVIKEDIVIE